MRKKLVNEKRSRLWLGASILMSIRSSLSEPAAPGQPLAAVGTLLLPYGQLVQRDCFVLRDRLDGKCLLQLIQLGLEYLGVILRLGRGEQYEDRRLAADCRYERGRLRRRQSLAVEDDRRQRAVPSRGALFVQAMQMVVGELFAGVERVQSHEPAAIRRQIQFEKLQRYVADYGRVGGQRRIQWLQRVDHRGVRWLRAETNGGFRS